MNEFRKFCRVLADESGRIITNYWRQEISVETKSDLSPVTVADKLAEEKIRELIRKEYPDHGIIGEEFPDENGSAEFKWIIDPIDGTKSFICGTVLFGTLIALIKDGKPLIGVINQPVMKEFLIGDNFSAQLNGEEVRVRECKSLQDAVLLCTDHLNVRKYQDINKFDTLTGKVKIYRNWGDCYGYYLLATGYADIMIDPVMSVWDTMALIPIINGAGGIITDYHGNDPVKGNSIIAAVPELHKRIINILN